MSDGLNGIKMPKLFKHSESSKPLQHVAPGDVFAPGVAVGSKTDIAFKKLQKNLETGLKDIDGALALLNECVKEEDKEALWMMGLCYEHGIGVEQDVQRGLDLYKQSFIKGSEMGNFLANKIFKDFRGKDHVGLGCLLCFFFFFFL